MKKISVIILVLIILISNFSLVQASNYQLLPDYEKVMENIIFQDINKSNAKSAITKLSSLGIYNIGTKNFNPKSSVSKREALEYIINILGIKEDPVTSGLELGIITAEEVVEITKISVEQMRNINEKINELSYKEDSSPEKISNARKTEIENATWGKAITREEAGLWISKALGMDPQVPLQTRMFKDYNNFNSNTARYIEALIQKAYISGYGTGEFKPKQNITREELSSILEKILDPILINRNYNIKEGQIHKIENAVDISTGSRVNKTIYYIENFDGTYSSIENTGAGNNSSLGKYIKYYIDENNRVLYIEQL